MKKAVLFCFCLLCGAGAFAQNASVYAHKTGDVVLGLGAKTAFPMLGTDWGEFNVENETRHISHDAKPGDPSLGGDLQAVYFVTPWLALGASVGMEYFHKDLASGLYMNVKTVVRNYLALARVYVNPSQDYRFYMPLAAGMGEISADIDMDPYEKFRYSGFAGHIGLGVEKSFSEHWGLALEARYNHNVFHRTKTNAHGDVYRVYPRLDYISYSLRADYRF